MTEPQEATAARRIRMQKLKALRDAAKQPGDPTAMLALGFVVLACFTIGALVDVIKLPHITGYLVAGILFGPSIGHFIPFFGLWLWCA